MVVLGILLASLVLFRGLGVLGVELFSTWEVSAVWALAVMFLFTASAHFTKTKEDLIAMVPKAFPNLRFLVYLTGLWRSWVRSGCWLRRAGASQASASSLCWWRCSRPM